MNVTHTHRGVVYGARVVETQHEHGADHHVELTVGGAFLARASLNLRIDGAFTMLGGDEQSASVIYIALERALKAALAREP